MPRSSDATSGAAAPATGGRRWWPRQVGRARAGEAPRPWLGKARDQGHCDDDWNELVRGESPVRRADRNFADLLQETRVLQTGVQVLFALIATAVFTGHLGRADDFARIVYVVTLAFVVLAAALLIGPVAYHRAFFRTGRKPRLVELSHQLVRLALVALLVALAGSVVLVLDVLLDRPVALAVSGALTTALVLIWFVLPARAHRREPAPDAVCEPGPDAVREPAPADVAMGSAASARRG